MADGNGALGELVMLQQIVLRAWLGQLLTCLVRDGSLDGELFLERLYILQSNLPAPDEAASERDAAQARVGLGELGKLIEMTETAIADAVEPSDD